MWVPTKSNVLGRFKIYPKSLYACHGIGIFDTKKKEIQQKIDTIYTPHGVVLFGCYLHFIFNPISRVWKKNILRTGAH